MTQNQTFHRVMGFDFGIKYIGVATGQTLTQTAEPITSLQADNGIPDWTEIQALILHWKPTRLVVGLPYNLDGSTQLITLKAKKFGHRLHDKFKLPIEFIDETLTTWEAKQNVQPNTSNKQALKKLNAMAAVLILEQWLHDNASSL